MSTKSNFFELKPSRIAWFFQLCIAFILLFSCYQVLQLWAFTILCVLLAISFYLFKKKTTVLQSFSLLSERTFSLKFLNDAITYQLELRQVVDHQLYIVLYWRTDGVAKSTVIWRDQLDLEQWKYLKTLAILSKAK